MEESIREICHKALNTIQEHRKEYMTVPPALMEYYFRDILSILDRNGDDGK